MDVTDSGFLSAAGGRIEYAPHRDRARATTRAIARFVADLG